MPENKPLGSQEAWKPPRWFAVPVFLPQSHTRLPGWILRLPGYRYSHFSKHGRNFARLQSGRSPTSSFFSFVDHRSFSAMRKKQSQSEKDFSSQMKIRKTDNLASKKGYDTKKMKRQSSKAISSELISLTNYMTTCIQTANHCYCHHAWIVFFKWSTAI